MPEDIVRQLEPLFKPKAVAFIGASNDPRKWGFRMLYNAYRSGFPGPLYPVNLREREVQGLPAYPRLGDVPGEVDLAVITVPAPQAPQVIRGCLAKEVRAAIIITAGFAETGEEGARRQREVVALAREGGVRLVGPNCMGIWSAPARLNLPFDGGMRSGRVAFVSQSGRLGGSLAERALAKGYGLSYFVSCGNQADLTFTDYLEYLAEDEATQAIVLYIEGISDGRRFMEVARRVLARKPIVVFKGGRTDAGARAALSHTASLAGNEAIFDAMCRQVGIIRSQEPLHAFDMAVALAHQPLPPGRRVAIIGGGGGHCVTTADACAALGLEVPEFDGTTQERLIYELEPHAPLPLNPVDTAGGGTAETVPHILEVVAPLDYIDGFIAPIPNFGAGHRLTAEMARATIDAAEAIAAIPSRFGKPVIATSFASDAHSVGHDIVLRAGIPIYDSPEECARAMFALARYAEVKRRLAPETDVVS